ncbi:hypothetical protein WICPIJ_002601 [Wickerhamomyces pijperi]|uniref:Metal homeostatis protein BSD2 n=1 Tax=Wickerhamomyces pijperi TaxID=599730 RepID=A0A9P8Q9D8_WICPI|nr:hypothetical protein WICPIJ_002601 [Wickerhamomyces pijperi]
MVSYQRVNTELQDLSQFDIDLEAQTHDPLLLGQSQNHRSTNKLSNGSDDYDEEDPDNVRDVNDDEDFSDFDHELGTASAGASSSQNTTSNNMSDNNRNPNIPSFATTRAQIMSGSNTILRTMSRYFNYLDNYNRTASTNGASGSASRINIGGGSQNDGVFSNLSAKPDLQPAHTSDLPPTYIEASSDTSPPYWESTILNPHGNPGGLGDEIFIDGLPVGNIINFIWNALVSLSFQYVGFVLTFVLHTSHAAKEGSKVGLGVTFIMLGWAAMPSWNKAGSSSSGNNLGKLSQSRVQPGVDLQDVYEDVSLSTDIKGTVDQFVSDLPGASAQAQELLRGEPFSWKLWIGGLGLVLFGVWIIVFAVKGYLRAREMERVILMPPQEVNIHPEPETAREEAEEA